MTSNIYDNFRSVQETKKQCHDKRSAAFINTGRLSQDITHIRTDEDIKAAIVITHKEGPDETFVYTYKEDDLLKTDYFIYDSVNYLVYEDIKLTDDDIDYKKQKAVECNVAFTHNSITYKGYFTSSIRTITENEFVGSQAILPDETPLLIVPTGALEIGDRFTIEGKPFKIQEYDSITNKGITYLYLQRDYVAKDETEVVEEEDVVAESIYAAEDTALNEQTSTVILRQMTEYFITTVNGLFASTPGVEVLSRKATEVRFRVPFGVVGTIAITASGYDESLEVVL